MTIEQAEREIRAALRELRVLNPSARRRLGVETAPPPKLLVWYSKADDQLHLSDQWGVMRVQYLGDSWLLANNGRIPESYELVGEL